MKVRLLWFLAIAVVSVAFVPAQDTAPSFEDIETPTIVFLFDLSYSMTLQASVGGSRLQAAQQAAKRIVNGGDASWALLAFEDTGALLGQRTPNTDPHATLARIQELLPWGRSPIADSVRRGVEIVDGPARLIVLSDLLDSEPADAPRQTVEALVASAREKEVAVSFLYEPLDTPAQAIGWATRVAVETGGTVARLSSPEPLISTVIGEKTARESGTASPGGEVNGATEARSSRAVPRVTLEAQEPRGTGLNTHEGVPTRMRDSTALDRSRGSGAARLLSRLLLGLGAGAAAYAVRRFLVWRKLDAAAAASIPRPVFDLTVVDPDHRKTPYRFDRFPVTVGNGSNCTIHLSSPFPGRAGRSPDIRIERESARAVFTSNALFNINGAGKRRKVLKSGDRIQYGRYTILFGGLEWDRPVATPSKAHLRFAALPIAAFALALVFRIDAMESAVSFNLERAPAPRIETDRTRHAEEGRLDRGEGSETESAEVVVVEHQAAGVAANLDLSAEASAVWNCDARLSGKPPLRASYPDLAGVTGVDVLFIHAHPDDEALDYGALLAAAESADKRVGVVLFTDGNAGLDQYPWRAVDTEYPSWRMRDSELSTVRVEEATRAMTRLGADLYVRLGLQNHPYSGTDEELSVEEVTARWGGADALTEIVADIIRRLNPTLVVSPDGPSEAYEHFEHEAVGEITADALRSLGGRSSIRAHLTPVDPLQTDAYRDVLAFDAWERPADGTFRYRDVQLAALREHRSQRDASVIGIEVRQGLRYEYYRAVRWTLRSEIPTPSFADLLSAVFDRP